MWHHHKQQPPAKFPEIKITDIHHFLQAEAGALSFLPSHSSSSCVSASGLPLAGEEGGAWCWGLGLLSLQTLRSARLTQSLRRTRLTERVRTGAVALYFARWHFRSADLHLRLPCAGSIVSPLLGASCLVCRLFCSSPYSPARTPFDCYGQVV